MNIIIDNNATKVKFNHHWRFAVGSCHAALAHRQDYLAQLRTIKEELGITRVRFHGIFNDDMNVYMSFGDVLPLPSAKKFKEISFYQVGKVYDNILALGMTPLVEIGFMPKELASGKRKCSFHYKGNITMPKVMAEWSDFIEKFVTFLVKRYGYDMVSTWIFEVWNEPNLPVFFKGSQKDYFQLYAATALAIKKVCKDAQVGGPATAACAWVEDFVRFCQTNNVPYDFVSTHAYGGETLGHVLNIPETIKKVFGSIKEMRKHKGGGVLEGARIMFKDNSYANNNHRNAFVDNAAAVKKLIKDKPLYFTEWGVNATCTAPINDDIRAASYAIKSVLGTHNSIDGSSYWCFSDLFEEMLFFPYEFSGAFGMQTISGIFKPQFYAFKLLSLLGDTLIVTDAISKDIEYAVFQKDNATQILLYHQSFLDANDLVSEVHIDLLTELAPTAVTIQKIDQTHCNPVAIWRQLGSPQHPTVEELSKIKLESSLYLQDYPFTYQNNTISLDTKIYTNNVQLITFKF